MLRRFHLGTGFEIWTAQQSWFWRLADSARNGGTIGAAATELGAIRDACHAIEELRTFSDNDAADFAKFEWDRCLASLANYLDQTNDTV